jgi:hypothetical protein
MKKMIFAPIILFVNHPWQTRRTVEGLQKNKPTIAVRVLRTGWHIH